MKFKLTSETKVFLGRTLYRIEALIDFGIVKKGELGGYVEKETNLSQNGNAWVSDDARVYGAARVYGDAQVYGDAWVYGAAQVYGDAWVYGAAQVGGNAQVYGAARVYGAAQVGGNAQVYGAARVSGAAQVYGAARVSGAAQVYGAARVSDESKNAANVVDKSEAWDSISEKNAEIRTLRNAGVIQAKRIEQLEAENAKVWSLIGTTAKVCAALREAGMLREGA